MGVIKETSELLISGRYDVIVVGGGISGIGAAISAAREGMQTLIIEKTICLGGQATLGHVVKYLALCDGYGKQVIGGISEELLKKSILYGYDNLPFEWKEKLGIHDNKQPDAPEIAEYLNNPHRRCETFFNMPAFLLALDEMVEQNGVDVLFDTIFCNVIMDGSRCTGLIVENKSGRSVYQAKMVIDASGDADVMFRAGARCFDQGNHVTYLCYDTDFSRMSDAIKHNNMYRAFPSWRMLGYNPLTKENPSEHLLHGTNAEEVNEFVKLSRRSALEFLKRNQRPDYTMISVPTIPAFRTTRRIVGRYELKPDDVHRHFEDSIGCTGDWRRPGPVFEIPYRSLTDERITNILAVGRIIASSGDAWEVTRVIPPAAMTGQAAGIAAAMAIRADIALQLINIDELQKKLEQGGVFIHEN